MSKYIELTLGGETVRKHRRDVNKDAVIMESIPEQPCSIFEASAGSAILSRQLKEMGHQVSISNYYMRGFKEIQEFAADLNKPLDIPDNSFDVVICREVIEHVESVPHTLREFHRILKDGGTLILTFPNRLQIRSRFLHLFSGFYRGMKSPINLDVRLGEAHSQPLSAIPRWTTSFARPDTRSNRVGSSYFQASDNVFLLLKPFIALTTYYYLLRYKKKRPRNTKRPNPKTSPTTAISPKHCLSNDLFLGKDVIIAATKQSAE